MRSIEAFPDAILALEALARAGCPVAVVSNLAQPYGPPLHTLFGEHVGTFATLSTLVDRSNEHFGTDFTKADKLFIDAVRDDLEADGDLQKAARVNSPQTFGLQFRPRPGHALANRQKSQR